MYLLLPLRDRQAALGNSYCNATLDAVAQLSCTTSSKTGNCCSDKREADLISDPVNRRPIRCISFVSQQRSKSFQESRRAWFYLFLQYNIEQLE